MRLNQHISFIIYNLRGKDIANLKLSQEDKKFVDHYCKIQNKLDITDHSSIKDISLFSKTGYTYDIKRIIKQDDNLRFRYRWGDETTPPDEPTLLKCRKISETEGTSVLLPLNTGRNFFIVHDHKGFEQKKDIALWRGAVFSKPWRKEFLARTENLPQFDTANTQPLFRGSLSKMSRPNYMSIKEHLNYKFIVSIEGSDAATNIKWIMQTNSLLMMPKPRFETWFGEGLLQAGRHYIEIASDYSNLEEVFEKYITQPKLCREIIQEAKAHANFFFPLKKQFAIGREVVNKYRELTHPL